MKGYCCCCFFPCKTSIEMRGRKFPCHDELHDKRSWWMVHHPTWAPLRDSSTFYGSSSGGSSKNCLKTFEATNGAKTWLSLGLSKCTAILPFLQGLLAWSSFKFSDRLIWCCFLLMINPARLLYLNLCNFQGCFSLQTCFLLECHPCSPLHLPYFPGVLAIICEGGSVAITS